MSTPAESSAAAGGETDAPATPAPSGSRVLITWTVVLAAAVLAADQLTKWWAESALVEGGEPIRVIGELLQLRLVYNPGAALSIATGMTWVLTIIVVVVVIAILRLMRRIGSRGWAVSLGLLLGGAVGNLTDRLLRDPGFARGHVVDFIDYAGFFVGNVADIAIVVAAVWIAVLSLLGIGVDGRRESDGSRHAEQAADEAGRTSGDADGVAGPA
ncbi:signal peptidase II [Myceligenerans pegani]|uniref:Lipoprotein signal peptidase n=1 Tax=Myceligenerans pegani TaxID=2776917 RepID=A0ABR9MZK8_9MICO|nr:signal peptidase II [Myceligenerans sp. TRM 65318]MBE1876461.1 signal peptidase II [Myceligenerans sp. TRM 65318]MBE3018732.1 signal peptidase II [Myceligenerans sp. TRM 65318]